MTNNEATLQPRTHPEENIDLQSEISQRENVLDCSESTLFEDRHFLSLLLEPRSLVLIRDDMYKVHLHGIREKLCDVITDKVANVDLTSAELGDEMKRETRVSLTIRNVPKVLKAKLFFNKK